MELKLLFIVLLASMAVAAQSSSFMDESIWGFSRFGQSCTDSVGECIGEQEDFVLDVSEATRRVLYQKGKFISYGALKANQVPCGRRGSSYYNCQRRQRANPYRRGCNAITRCARYTD